MRSLPAQQQLGMWGNTATYKNAVTNIEMRHADRTVVTVTDMPVLQTLRNISMQLEQTCTDSVGMCTRQRRRIHGLQLHVLQYLSLKENQVQRSSNIHTEG